MKTKIFILFFIILGIFKNAEGTVFYIYSTVIAATTDPYCSSTHVVEVKWRADQLNNNYFEVLRRTDPNVDSWTVVSPNINGCGTCTQSYEYIDYGPFTEGVNYYYTIKATSNLLNHSYHDIYDHVIFSVPHSKDWKKQTTDNILIGSTSSNRNDFTWHEESNIMQGVRLNLIPPERVPIYVQQNNSIINFELNEFKTMSSIEININYQGWNSIYQDEPINSYIWSNSTNLFNTIGHYYLKVRFLDPIPYTFYYREYDIYVIPASQKLYKDNYCNTIRCWQGTNPNGIPVVFSEGFDAYDCTTQEFYYLTAEDVFNCLKANGYNIYLLDNKFGTQDIRNNAAGFDAAIRYISSINGSQQVVAGGASMGGMIARYAFAKAEQDGVPLPASKFVSIDSPQQGAVISKLLQDYKKDKQECDPFAAHGLNNDAAKELLNYNTYDPNHETANSIHNQFYNELNSLNGDGYPHLTENIGVSFSSNTPSTYSGRWLEIVYENWYTDGTVVQDHFDLETEEMGAGSYLPIDLTTMSPVIMRSIDWWVSCELTWAWNSVLGISLFNYPWVSVNRISHPCYIPYNSALDIVNGQSKFDVVIETSQTTHHDEVPADIIDPLINAIMFGGPKYLQNQTVTNAVTYNNYKKIFAGNNVTNKIPVGDYVIQDGANVTFIAGEEINLEPGFEAGYDFEAYIEEMSQITCNSTLKYISQSPENTDDKLKVYNNEKINIKLMPNPNDGNFTITISDNSEYTKSIEIYNTLGDNIYRSDFETNSKLINISQYPKGIYIVKVFSGNKVFVEKVVYK